MKKLQFFAMAALVAVGLSNCSKEENGVTPPSGADDAKMRLSFSIPAGAKTRASQNANSNESAVDSVYVFIFDAGGVKAVTGGYTALSIADDFGNVTQDLNGNDVYTLKSDKAIETIAGNARIYVGVNLPDAITDADFDGYDNESALLAQEALTTGMTGEFTMFSKLWNESELVKFDELDPTNTTNVVKVAVDRVVSKVVTTAEKKEWEVTWGEEAIKNLAMKYTVREFNVYNEAYNSYLVERTDGTTLSDLYLHYQSYFKDADADAAQTLPLGGANENGIGFKDAEAAGAFNNTNPSNILNTLPGFYIGENVSTLNDETGKSLVGKTTYAMVATQVQIYATAKWDATLNDNEGGVVWTDLPAGTVLSSDPALCADLYVVTNAGKTYVTDKKAEAEGLATAFGTTYITYEDSYVHFLVWLNHNDVNKADINRNQFIHLNVNGIIVTNGNEDGIFPGYPGTPGDPQRPIDPTDVTNNPDPLDPTDPIDGAPAYLVVEVTVNPWVYMSNDVPLQ
jgi:hypothetical protein